MQSQPSPGRVPPGRKPPTGRDFDNFDFDGAPEPFETNSLTLPPTGCRNPNAFQRYLRDVRAELKRVVWPKPAELRWWLARVLAVFAACCAYLGALAAIFSG